jgi:hypothetical protein
LPLKIIVAGRHPLRGENDEATNRLADLVFTPEHHLEDRGVAGNGAGVDSKAYLVFVDDERAVAVRIDELRLGRPSTLLPLEQISADGPYERPCVSGSTVYLSQQGHQVSKSLNSGPAVTSVYSSVTPSSCRGPKDDDTSGSGSGRGLGVPARARLAGRSPPGNLNTSR